MSNNLNANIAEFSVKFNKLEFSSLSKNQIITIILRIGKKENRIVGKYSELHFQDKSLCLNTHLYSDKTKTKFHKRIAEIDIYTGEAISEAFYGRVKIDIAEFGNNRIGEYTDDFKLEKCSCQTSSMNLQLTLDIQEINDSSHSNQNSSNHEKNQINSPNQTYGKFSVNENTLSPRPMRSIIGKKKMDRSPSFCADRNTMDFEESTKDFNSKVNGFVWSFVDEDRAKNIFNKTMDFDENCKADHKGEIDASSHVKSYKIEVNAIKNNLISPRATKTLGKSPQNKSDFIKDNIERAGKISLANKSPLHSRTKVPPSSRDALKGMVTMRNRETTKLKTEEAPIINQKSFDVYNRKASSKKGDFHKSNNYTLTENTDIDFLKKNKTITSSKGKQKLLEMLISKVSNIENSVRTMHESKSQASIKVDPESSKYLQEQENYEKEFEMLKLKEAKNSKFLKELAFILGCDERRGSILDEVKKLKKAQSFDEMISNDSLRMKNKGN